MKERQEILNGFAVEMRRGTVVLSVLSRRQSPKYGYSLIQELKQNEFGVEANTLYPLLRRLEKQGILRSEWETQGAKPRKYYVLTDFGKEIFEELKTYWKNMQSYLNVLVNGEDC